MRCITNLSDYKSKKRSAVTFGKFDGLHAGHMLLVKEVCRYAEEEDLTSIVCAFEMREFWKILGREPKLLMTPDERAMHLEGYVDYLVNYPFTVEFSTMEPEVFIKQIIHDKMHAKHIVVGTDFTFGSKAKGNVDFLKLYEEKYDYKVHAIDKIKENDRVISSSYIRESLSNGDVHRVNKLLGYEYEISGPVVHGKKLGRNLGFPTINIEWNEHKIAPPRGVYFVDVILDNQLYHAIANVGVKPTVSSDNKLGIECFLFNYSGEAYEHEVRVKLLEYIRPEKKFRNVEEMANHVALDIAAAKAYFGLQ